MKSTLILSMLMSLFLMTSPADAGNGITYQGRLVKDGKPVEARSVQFLAQIRTPLPADCLMYEEIRTINMTGSNGYFTFKIGDGSANRRDRNGWDLRYIFRNHGRFVFGSGLCLLHGYFQPSRDDGRRVVVYFNDGTFRNWEPLPDMDSSPVAHAIEAQQIGGFTEENLLRVAEGDDPQEIPAFSLAQFTELLAIINGTTTKYVKSGEASTSVTNIAATAPLTATSGTTPSISIAKASATSDGYLSSTDWTTFNNKQSASLASGKIWVGGASGTATAVTMSGDATLDSNGNFALTSLQGKALSASSPARNQFLKFDGTSWKTASMTLSDVQSGGVSGGSILPSTACAANEALSWSPINDAFVCQTLDFVTSNDARLSDSRTPAGLASGDLSGSYPNPQVVKIQGVEVDSSLPTDGQLMAYDGATSKWRPKSVTNSIASGGTGTTSLMGNSIVMTNSAGSALMAVQCASGEVLQFNGSTWVCQSNKNTVLNGGNSVTETMILGTNNSQGMALKTNGVSRVNIAVGGEVGIGTTPSAKLDVAGEVKFGNSSVACTSVIEGAQRYNSTSKKMEFCNGTNWAPMGGWTQSVVGSASSGSCNTYCSNNGATCIHAVMVDLSFANTGAPAARGATACSIDTYGGYRFDCVCMK